MNEERPSPLHFVIAIFSTNFRFLHTSCDFSKQLIHFLATIYTLLLPKYFNSIQFNSIPSLFPFSLSSLFFNPYTLLHLSHTIKLSFKSPPSFPLYKDMAFKVQPCKTHTHHFCWCSTLLCFHLLSPSP